MLILRTWLFLFCICMYQMGFSSAEAKKQKINAMCFFLTTPQEDWKIYENFKKYRELLLPEDYSLLKKYWKLIDSSCSLFSDTLKKTWGKNAILDKRAFFKKLKFDCENQEIFVNEMSDQKCFINMIKKAIYLSWELLMNSEWYDEDLMHGRELIEGTLTNLKLDEKFIHFKLLGMANGISEQTFMRCLILAFMKKCGSARFGYGCCLFLGLACFEQKNLSDAEIENNCCYCCLNLFEFLYNIIGGLTDEHVENTVNQVKMGDVQAAKQLLFLIYKKLQSLLAPKDGFGLFEETTFGLCEDIVYWSEKILDECVDTCLLSV
ncbi:MAG: hypothetical protein UR26_C0002G0192 [candidate division TM6 bacterium GW2011_GWF2_32_72]|nr:MAG: hypothetical protein UR26_C0002G0192 [candidate division TM6 bacterium GW2011_GWF2_32_72]